MSRALASRVRLPVMMAVSAALAGASVPALGAQIHAAPARSIVLTSSSVIPVRANAGLSPRPSRMMVAYIASAEESRATCTAKAGGGTMDAVVRDTTSGDGVHFARSDRSIDPSQRPYGLSFAPAGLEAKYLNSRSHSVLEAQNTGGNHRWVYAGIKTGGMTVYPFAKWALRFRSSW